MSDLLRTISAEDVIGWEPCAEWDDDRIRELLPEPVPVLDVCDLRRFRGVSAGDRLWVLLRPEILADRDLRLFACDCAERALRRDRKAGREPDPASWQAVEVSRRYAVGDATETELIAAGSVAWSVAGRAAAVNAAWSAALSAAWSAAGDAARSAALSAAWSAEHRWQLLRVAHYLRGEDS